MTITQHVDMLYLDVQLRSVCDDTPQFGCRSNERVVIFIQRQYDEDSHDKVAACCCLCRTHRVCSCRYATLRCRQRPNSSSRAPGTTAFHDIMRSHTRLQALPADQQRMRRTRPQHTTRLDTAVVVMLAEQSLVVVLSHEVIVVGRE